LSVRGLFASFRVLGYVVLAVMTVALLYAAYTALVNWPSIAV
jgi:hypothetical protein